MDLSGVRVELADPQGQLLEEIANPKMKRRDVAQTYAFALRSHDRVNWLLVNGAIIDRWSVSGLKYIKDRAWEASARAAAYAQLSDPVSDREKDDTHD